MLCADETPTTATEWAELARCLQDEHLPSAALVAWHHALERGPELVTMAAAPVQELAHATGDDRLLVEIGRALDDPDPDPDLAGHLAYAAAVPGAPDEADLLASVPEKSCRYPYAQYRLAALLDAAGKQKSEVMALRAATEAPEDALGDAPVVALDHLKDAALLQAASVYAVLGRPEEALQYVKLEPTGLPAAPYATYLEAWADHDAHQLGSVDQILPEAAALRAQLDPRVRAAETRRWTRVRTELSTFEARWQSDPAGAGRAVLHAGLPRTALYAAGGMGPTSEAVMRSGEIDAEARLALESPVVEPLVEEARADAEGRSGQDALALIARGVDRIDRALASLDGSPTVHWWSEADFGW